MEETSQSSGFWKVLTGFLAIIVAIFAYLLFDANSFKKSQEDVIRQKVQALSSTSIRLDSIGIQLDAKIAQIKSLGGKVEDLEATKKQLENDRMLLRRANTFSVAQYEERIKEYVSILVKKDTEIAKFKKENTKLLEKNKSLVSENVSLSSENILLKMVKQGLSDSLEVYAKRNQALTATVNLASSLQAQLVKVNAISRRNKERSNGVYRVSKIEKIKIAFQLQPNLIAKQNVKSVFVRVLDPDGAVMFDTNAGSGNFELAGKETTYTVKKDILYQNNGQAVEMIYARGGATKYRIGHYAVEIFCEGYKIGSGSFDVK